MMKVAKIKRAVSTVRASFALESLAFLCLIVLLAPPAWSDEMPAEPTTVPAAQAPPAQGSKAIPSPGHHNRPEHGSLADIGAKLSDPTSNIWALQFNIQGPTFYDGDVNFGSPKVGGNVIFQPVLPFPLY
jgi:hypothetical protein